MQNTKVTRKGKHGPIPARLFFLFARESPVAVVFRRGPSRWIQLISWRTDSDVFEAGQWFHGRVYERRADLSPDGSLLIYFANKINDKTLKDEQYTYAWTAISKPPYFTALALWPKGDCWHGGGLFSDNKTVVLNHRPDAAAPHPSHKPKPLRVILKKNVSGEDDPLFAERLERDGWRLEQEWKVENRGHPQMFVTTQSEVRIKSRPGGLESIRLTRSIHGLDYAEEFTLLGPGRSFSVALDGASWADWDQQGRLVFAAGGKVMTGELRHDGSFVQRSLLDLNSSRPSPVTTPGWAARW
jgi:hypothetical protein